MHHMPLWFFSWWCMHAFTENDLENQDLDDGDGEIYEDDEARASNVRGNVCMMISMLHHSTTNGYHIIQYFDVMSI